MRSYAAILEAANTKEEFTMHFTSFQEGDKLTIALFRELEGRRVLVALGDHHIGRKEH